MLRLMILTFRSEIALNPIRIIRCGILHRIFWKPYAVRLAEEFIRIIRILELKHTTLYIHIKKSKTYTRVRARRVKMTPYNPYNPYKACPKPL